VAAAALSVFAFTGFFDLIETRFYNPSIANSQIREVTRDAQTIHSFLAELEKSFSDTLADDAVRRSFLPNQSAQDIFDRTRIYGLLLESQKGIQSVRFVDSGGLRIHFSTNPEDLLSQGEERIAYRNYTDTVPFTPYDVLAVPDQGSPKLFLDQRNDRVVFSFPFYDSLEVYRGTALYSVSVRAVADMLVTAGRLRVGEDLSLISVPAGMVSGMAYSGKEVIIPIISSIWAGSGAALNTLDSGNSTSSLVLVSAQTETGLFIGRVVEERIFAFPGAMKLILLVSLFLTLYLTIFLCFNLRADTMTVIQNRLKNLELSLIREYYERKGEMDWNHWYRELENRRKDVQNELKRGIKTKNAAALMEDIDSLINKSWDEILTAIGGKRETRLAIDEDKLQNILNRVLLAAGTSPVVPGGGVPKPLTIPITQTAGPAAAHTAEEAEVVEELGEAEVEEAEAVEELGDGEVEETEPMGELGEAGVEEAEAVEELGAAEVEDAEQVEELGDGEAEEAEQVGESGEAEAADFDDAEVLEELDGEELEDVPREDLPKDSAAPGTSGAGVKEDRILTAEEIAGAEAELASQSRKKSNIQLVFGDDDIPYIVESSGLELVDDGDDVSAINNINTDDEIGELEELDDDDIGELGIEKESPVEEPAVSAEAPPAVDPAVNAASRIEFSEAGETAEEEELVDNLEIVSPFATMLSRFNDDGILKPSDDDTERTKTPGQLEELNDEGMSLIYQPFQNEETHSPELLDSAGPAGIIEEKDGVNYVNETVKFPNEETEKNLDQGLKSLVNSVIKK
jgi:hypothetical protein